MTVRRAVLAAAASAAVALGVAPGPGGVAAAPKDDPSASVLFARGSSLWRTDARGKGPAVEVVALPGDARGVRMIRSDAAGAVVLIDHDGAWWWARLDGGAPATPERLPCADAPARLTADGRIVTCADAAGHALLVGLVTGRVVETTVPADGARVIVRDGARWLVWADGEGIWETPLARPDEKRALAPEPPRRGLVPSPDGRRGVAVHEGTVIVRKQRVPAEVLDTFALDGRAARRMLHHAAAVIVDWSWDGEWLLLQDGAQACITRAVGGQYTCWKGYDALSIAPDGRWALLAGARRDAGGAPAPAPRAEPPREGTGDDDGDDDDGAAPAAAAVAGPRSLYRGRLEGAYTDPPVLVERIVDAAAALWVP